MTRETLPEGTRIGRTALRVGDRERVAEFYRQVVGLSVLTRGETATELGVGGRSLLVVEDGAPVERGNEAGLYHHAFRVPSRDALGDALERIRGRWRLEGASDHGVSEALYLSDPAGNGVEIYHDFPESAWPTDPDGSMQMWTKPLDLDAIEAAAAGTNKAPPGTDVGHVHLEVTSLEAFEEFYLGTLGFETQFEIPDARFVSAGGYHHHIGANTWHDRTDPAGESGISWFEIVVPDGATLEAVRGRVADSSHEIAETESGFECVDPDGIAIRVRTER